MYTVIDLHTRKNFLLYTNAAKYLASLDRTSVVKNRLTGKVVLVRCRVCSNVSASATSTRYVSRETHNNLRIAIRNRCMSVRLVLSKYVGLN